MNDEASFIKSILVNPGDPVARLVYADWLDEQGDPKLVSRAEYLRIECELDREYQKENKRRQLEGRLLELRKSIGDDWWRELDWAKVEYCCAYEFSCPQRWDTLQPTEDPALRFCKECRKKVLYCSTAYEALQLANAGECAAMDSRLAGTPLEMISTRSQARWHHVGKVKTRIPDRIPLNQRGRKTE